MKWLPRPLKIIRFDVVDSTQDVALRNKASLLKHDLLIISQTQTQGKGRGDHSWKSPKGGLWFTYATKWGPMPDPVTSRFMHYATALAATTAVSNSTSLSPKIKWPNDLVIDGKKLGGILIDVIPQGQVFVFFGIGINTNNRAPLLENESRKDLPISIRDLTGEKINNESLAKNIILELKKMLLFVSAKKFESIRRRFNEILYQKGELVDTSRKKAWLQGITPDGLLTLLFDNETATFDIGGILLFQ